MEALCYEWGLISYKYQKSNPANFTHRGVYLKGTVVFHGTRMECSWPQKCLGSRIWSTVRILFSSLIFHCLTASVFLSILFLSIRISIPGEETHWPSLTEGLTWFNSHGQRRQGHVAHSGCQSCLDMKKAPSGKESSADCGVSPLWHGGSVPSQGEWGDICDIQCATAE